MTSRLGDKLTGRISRVLEKKYTLQAIDTGAVTQRILAVRTDTVNFYICLCGDGIACIDTGYRPLVIRDQLKSLNIDPDKVTHVFLTHADIDHAGGLGVFRNAEIFLSSREEQMIRGFRSIRSAVRSPRIRRAYRLLCDNDTVAVGASTIKAIETPGHTPGSMAYLLDGAYLFMGDTCKLKDGQAYAGKHYTLDYETQKDSIRKLARLKNVQLVLTAHSGYTQDFGTAFDYWLTDEETS
jgi:glyoxylase-like metal-dependent hydrolase (beta-lactamase superfamily II)